MVNESNQTQKGYIFYNYTFMMFLKKDKTTEKDQWFPGGKSRDRLQKGRKGGKEVL